MSGLTASERADLQVLQFVFEVGVASFDRAAGRLYNGCQPDARSSARARVISMQQRGLVKFDYTPAQSLRQFDIGALVRLTLEGLVTLARLEDGWRT